MCAEKATIEQKLNAYICLAMQLTSLVHVLKKRPLRPPQLFHQNRARNYTHVRLDSNFVLSKLDD
jgi:hypothetical protein